MYNDYYDLSRLPVLDSDRVTLQAASFDRRNENGDFNQFLYKDSDDSMVMFDDRGSGVIKSIWTAIATDDTEICFYFGGSSTPRWTVTLRGLFTGGIPELSGVGNTYEHRGHGGEPAEAGNLFIPIPYENGLKITARGFQNFYYHIMYEHSADDRVDTLLLDRKDVITDTFRDAFAGRRTLPAAKKIVKEMTLSSMYTNLWSADKPGVITELTVKASKDVDLTQIGLDAAWDGDLISAVATPLSHLFAVPLGYTDITSHAVECRTEGDQAVMSCYMPFWKSAELTLVKHTDDEVKLTVEISVAENNYDPDTTGYFHADYREGKTELFGDWLLGQFDGRGSIVGMVQTCHGGQYCEGNEHFYINGSRSPQINGTGTEDFYLGCYWPNTKYDSVCGGCVNDVFELGDGTFRGAFATPTAYYRYLHDMPINFTDGIKLAIQHGAVGQTYSDYSSLCLSYRRDDAAMIQTDFIAVGSAGSRSLHGYEADTATAVTLTSQMEGDRAEERMSRDGYIHEGGEISFFAALRRDNKGACLRRMIDQSISPQSAEVYVDGEYVGVWCDPGYNCVAAFADSDFYIPQRFTVGADAVRVTLKPKGAYSDFEYIVKSRIK